MATLPTPEELARRILSIFALNNSRPDDMLMAEPAIFAFQQAGGSAAEFQAGLLYAVQNGWLEIGENDTIKLTNAGFAENVKPDTERLTDFSSEAKRKLDTLPRPGR